MWSLVFLALAIGAAIWIVMLVRGGSAESRPKTISKAPPAPRPGAPPPLARVAWDDPIEAPPPLTGEALRTRLRDRYIAARFPGVATGPQDLAQADRVIRSARLYFEEQAYQQALELLEMAIQQSPASEPLRLAQLEIAFLLRSAGRYTSLAREFRSVLPDSRNWSEVARLGRVLAPDHELFTAGPGSRPYEHYGPWPNLPNWIDAPWDLTGAVLAADFRRAILRDPQAQPARPPIAIGA